MNWSRDPPTRPIRLHSEGRQHLKLLPALSAPHMGWSLCSRLAWYHGSLKGIHPQRVGSGKLSKSQGDRETGNEEQHISPLDSVGRETNGAWLISWALGLLEQQGPECRRDVVQPACGRPGRPLVVRGAGPGGLGLGAGWDAALLVRQGLQCLPNLE